MGSILFSGCLWFHQSDFISVQYLENEFMEFDHILHICIDIDKIYVEIVMHQFSHFDHILHICIYIDKIYVGIVTRQFSQIYNAVMALDWCKNFVLCSLSDQILHMHWYWQDLGWDCYMSIFHKFITQLWCMIIVRISFPFNIFRTNRWNLTKFCLCIDNDKI